MTIAQSENLKRELTDKYVTVREGVAELRRFSGLTGQVKTVNMNGRALIQFDGPVDISWYDIDPTFLTVVAAPRPKTEAVSKKSAPDPVSSEKPKAPAGKSPLELARQQGASTKSASTAAPAGEGKKLSPLELARQQGASKAGGGAPAAAAGGKKLSPLEQARQQGAAKAGGVKAEVAAPQPAAVAPLEEVPVEEPSAAPVIEESPPPSAASSSGPAVATPGSTAEIIALARRQGAVKP